MTATDGSRAKHIAPARHPNSTRHHEAGADRVRTTQERPRGLGRPAQLLVAASGNDAGYGVTSLELLVDGGQVGPAATQSCPDGGCSLDHTFTVNAADYGGGAHDVKLVAIDGAGNSSTESWRMNVNPSGNVSGAEATATLKAAGATSDTPTVDLAPADDTSLPGSSPDVWLERSGTTVESVGAVAPSSMSTDPATGVTTLVPDADALKETTASGAAELQEIKVVPDHTAASATSASLTSTGAAAVSANTAGEVDTLIRPLFDGAMMFEVIRDPSAPESYSWRLDMEPGNTLKQIDPTTAVVSYEDGTQAFTIIAQAAHDATGAAVPTSLKVDSPTGFSVTVAHRAGPYVYPVLGGPGWEAAYTAPVLPPTATPGYDDDGWGDTVFGPPTPDADDPEYRTRRCNTSGPDRIPPCPMTRTFNFVDCYAGYNADEVAPGGAKRTPTNQCQEGNWGIRMSVHGRFSYLYGGWVKLRPSQWTCDVVGPRKGKGFCGRKVAANYKVGSQNILYQEGEHKIWVFGQFMYETDGFGNTDCEKIVGFLPTRPTRSGPFPGYEQKRWANRYVWEGGSYLFGGFPPGDWDEKCGFTEKLKADGSPKEGWSD